jgi:hypothetical protein
MNSTVRAAAKIIDELSQSNENNDMKKMEYKTQRQDSQSP